MKPILRRVLEKSLMGLKTASLIFIRRLNCRIKAVVVNQVGEHSNHRGFLESAGRQNSCDHLNDK